MDCLINAISEANMDGVADTINLEAGPYTLMVSNNNANGFNGLPSIISPITIRGTGADPTIIERGASTVDSFRILHVAGGGDLVIDGLTIRGGDTPASGGGIFNLGTLTLTNSTVSDNSSAVAGGGIWNLGTLTLTNSTVSANSASTGGGIFNNVGGQVVLNNSTVSDNIPDNCVNANC